MAKKERIQTTEKETPLTQKPTIRSAVTYIVDENGNEVEAEAESSPLRKPGPHAEAES